MIIGFNNFFIILYAVEALLATSSVTYRRPVYGNDQVTRTLKGNEERFELQGNLTYQGKFQYNFDQGKGNLVLVMPIKNRGSTDCIK